MEFVLNKNLDNMIDDFQYHKKLNLAGVDNMWIMFILDWPIEFVDCDCLISIMFSLGKLNAY